MEKGNYLIKQANRADLTQKRRYFQHIGLLKRDPIGLMVTISNKSDGKEKMLVVSRVNFKLTEKVPSHGPERSDILQDSGAN